MSDLNKIKTIGNEHKEIDIVKRNTYPFNGNILRKLRKEKKLSLDHVGVKVGVTASTITRWEKGTSHSPSLEREIALCNFFKVDEKFFRQPN